MSFTINKGSANTVVVTLTEKTTIDPVYYLFEFINTTGVNVYCIATDISTQTQRYNKFVITEMGGNDEAPFNGEVNLMAGDYVYNVYEAPSEDLDPTGLTIVETGNAKCVDDSINTNKIYTSGSLVNKVYNG